MWLAIPQNVGTLCSVMVHWCLCWHSLRILPNCPCWGMQPGLCPTSAVANLNLHLSRCFPLCLLYVSSFCLYTAIDDSRVGSFLISSSYFVFPNTCLKITWDFSILVRVISNIFVVQSKPALPALERLIHSNDEEVLTDACWALSYLSDGTNDKIQAVIEAGVCRRLVDLLL